MMYAVGSVGLHLCMCRGLDVDTSADVFFSQTALLLLGSSADMICCAWDQRLQEEIGLMGSCCCRLDCKALGVGGSTNKLIMRSIVTDRHQDQVNRHTLRCT